jgi:uncharacterized cupredoxin-like copper-binding protein
LRVDLLQDPAVDVFLAMLGIEAIIVSTVLIGRRTSVAISLNPEMALDSAWTHSMSKRSLAWGVRLTLPKQQMEAILVRSRTLFVSMALLAVVLAGCSGGGSAATKPTTASGGVQDLTIKGLDTLKFDPATLTVKSGSPVHLTLTNTGVLVHDWVIDDLDGKKVAIEAVGGKSAAIDFTPSKAGSYSFYCSQPGHTEAGMKGTLIVQ